MNDRLWFSPLQLKKARALDGESTDIPSKGYRLGILGAGQLAWMLAQAARDLGIDVHLFAEKPQESGVLGGYHTTLGSLSDSRALEQFSKSVDTLLIESELIPYEPLEQALKKSGTPIVPSLGCLEVARDKLRQKQLFDKLKLTTARWTKVPALTDGQDESFFFDLFKVFSGGFVLKWSLGGYDGKGVLVVRPQDWDGSFNHPQRESFRQRLTAFLDSARSRHIPVYAEELISYRGECALTTTVLDQTKTAYPLVLSNQDQGTCWQVRPARWDPELMIESLEHRAQEAASKIAAELGIKGTFALEFFLTQHHELILNEMAPRVHNSCHYSQIAGDASQFHNHIRAALGLSLKTPDLPPYYGMTNILGPEGYEGAVTAPNLPAALTQNPRFILDPKSPLPHTDLPQGSSYHWYDKPTTTTRRKLGHVNSWAHTESGFREELLKVEGLLKAWNKNYSTQL